MDEATSERGAKVRVRSKVRNVPDSASLIDSKSSGSEYARRKGVESHRKEVTVEEFERKI